MHLAAARLFTGDSADLLIDHVVEIEGGRVAAIAPRAAFGSEVQPVELGDVTLLPGLIDTHQHLCFDGNGTLEEQVVDRSEDELLERARANARRALRAGITTIRDLGDRDFVTLPLREDPDLPRILAAGPPLTADGGHCWFLGGGCVDRAALLAAVEEHERRGCDVVKIMVTGGVGTPAYPVWASQFSSDDLAAAVSSAHRLGLPVAAHCHGVDGIAEAVDAGVDTIEHCSFFTSEGVSEPDDALIDRISAAGIVVSATLGIGPDAPPPPPVIAANLPVMMGALRRLRERGATVVVGTDAGIGPAKPHDVLPHAAIDLAALGMAPAEVLETLTATAADVCGVGDHRGRLRPGYEADLLAVGGNPLVDPTSLLDVRGVWRGGRPVDLDSAPLSP